jgi:hypothetical protein
MPYLFDIEFIKFLPDFIPNPNELIKDIFLGSDHFGRIIKTNVDPVFNFS